MTDEILPRMFAEKSSIAASDPKGRVAKLVQFLQNEFHVNSGLPKEQYPGLPLLMSLLDMALDRRELFDAGWDVSVVAELREAIELGIFDVLEEALMKFPTNNHFNLLGKLFTPPAMPQVITTNYDLIVDTALMHMSQQRQGPRGRGERGGSGKTIPARSRYCSACAVPVVPRSNIYSQIGNSTISWRAY